MAKKAHGRKKNIRAIDFYAGVGGWSLGMGMAGIDVIASYEWWNKANKTNALNNHHETIECDIRQLDLNSLPKKIDLVVGSPPCTQFSYSNRGGSGDIEDGLKDIEKFLEVVDYVKPRFWAMENVPRVAKILELMLEAGRPLSRFRHLAPTIMVLDAAQWGVPQSRKRCIVGNFDFEKLHEFRDIAPRKNLGQVVKSLSSKKIIDPVYGIQLSKTLLTENDNEVEFSAEEERINREMKTYHPVYNNMEFPDRFDRPARTVTAVCTRVSRESIVIADPNKKKSYRRLTLRERASVQGFPANYQFFGNSHAEKLRMIGNAIPPPMTYFIAHALLGTSKDKVPPLTQAIKTFEPAAYFPQATPPDKVGKQYPDNRRFRSALPHLRFKSGVRFELGNELNGLIPFWSIRFFFGNSKNIAEVLIKPAMTTRLIKGVRRQQKMQSVIESLAKKMAAIDPSVMQKVWSHEKKNGTHPYKVVDTVGLAAKKIIQLIDPKHDEIEKRLSRVLSKYSSHVGFDKLLRNADSIYAGLVVGAIVNKTIKNPKGSNG